MNPLAYHLRTRGIIPAICICISLSNLAMAQLPSIVVPVSAESNHKIIFDNGKVRMYEVQLSKGRSTAFHEHTSDSFAVILATTTRANEPKNSERIVGPVQAGQVGLASTAKGPYTHRIEATGDVPYHVIAVEIFGTNRLGNSDNIAKRPAPFTYAAPENSRGRAYRLILKPGETAGPFERPANTAIFIIRGGRTSEIVDGKSPRLWDSETGSFRWNDESHNLAIRNEGATEVEMIEIEVF